jgi:hypothetical protein
MRRLPIALLAVMLALSWVPLRAAQAASIIKTEDGLEFKFGLVEKVQFYTLNGADFTDNVPACGGKQCNFRSFVSPDTNIGDSQLNIFNFTNLLFDLSKGPVSIHINLENEARIDENVADINHLNLERAALTYKTPGFGDLTVGFDVHLFDPEGGLVYQDEDPGIWLVGSQGMFSWNFGYHKRLSRNGGKPLGNLIGGITFNDGRARSIDVDTDILEGRVGLNFGPILSVSPFFLANIRHTRQGGDLFACPTDGATVPVGAPNPNCASIPGVSGGRSEIYYPGVVVTSKLGPLNLTVEGVGQFGEIRELGASQVALYGKSELDIESFAVFAEVALDLTAQGLGLTPYINLDYRRGDDSPLDGSLGGYVAISDLSQALRKDGFRLQSIQSLGAVTLGNGGEDGWGFNTSGRGVGPTIGTILEGLSTSSTFNSRFGKADNPGLLKISAGVLGKVNSMWDTHIGMSYIRFDTVEPIKIEAALNRDARLPGLTPAACKVAPTGGPANSGARAQCLANTLSVSEDAGVEFSFNVGYSPVPAFRIQPFVSVFVPLDAADDISRLFLSNDGSTRTAYTAGVEFRAQF